MLNNTPNGLRQLTTKLGIGFVIGFILVFSWPAVAEVFQLESQWTCGNTSELGKELQGHGEQIVGVGTMDDVVIISIWVNLESRAWTIVASPSAKKETSCIVIHGDKFKSIPITPGVSV
jgi:hypothetical protein